MALPKYQKEDIETVSTDYPFVSLQAIAENLETGFIVLWQYHGVFVRKIENKTINWSSSVVDKEPVIDGSETDHIIRIRAFNQTKEIHIWRKGLDDNNVIEFDGRKREDKISGSTISMSKIDTCMKLRGVIANQLKEHKEFSGIKHLKIKTRNYIGFNSIGQAGYVDSRFLKFI